MAGRFLAKRAFSTGIAPAVFKPKDSNGWLWKFAHALNPTQIPLSEAFPLPPSNVEFDKSLLAPPKTTLTQLSNGVKVASEDGGGHIGGVGVFVDAGSRLEGNQYMGATHFLQHLAFKSTSSRSHLRLVRDIENIGANTTAVASRENIMYSGEALRSKSALLLEILADTVLDPKFSDEELSAARTQIKNELDDLNKRPEALVLEAIHTAAYAGQSLGSPLLCPPRKLAAVDAETLLDFQANYWTPSRIVIAGSGVNHDDLVKQAEALFGSLPTKSAAAVPKAVYKGGEFRFGGDAEVELTTVAVALEGVSWSDSELYAACVLHTLMGGGGSFSAGGPGKGMHSRLYRNVLNQYHWVESATAFNTCYSDSGVFGIHGQCEPGQVGDIVKIFAEQLHSMAGTYTEEEVVRAKNQTKSAVLMNLEQRIVSVEDIGRQVLTYGQRHTAAHVSANIDKVSAADLQRVAKKMLKSPVSVAAHGDSFHLPRYEVVAAHFK